jgi:hypothetical protein
MGKISINGLKLSTPLVLIRVRLQQGALAAMPAFCRMLADLAVNIAFMASGDWDDTCSAFCCIDPTDRSSVVAGLAQNTELRTCVHIEPDLVGMISIYPHRSSMAVLGASLQALNESGIGIYALASSISALTFIVGCLQTDRAADALAASLGLPPDTVPSRAELSASDSQNGAVQTAGMDKNLETIAVYWEPIIRTYGFNLIEKLPLYRLSLPVDEIGSLGKALQLQGDDAAFRLVWATSDSPDQLHFFLLCSDRYKNELLPFMGHPKSSGCNLGQRGPTAQDIVFFQGPHFGDRSGIMNFTYEAIAHDQIPIRATACSVATIYLVVPAGWGRKTQDILTGAFEIPTSVK